MAIFSNLVTTEKGRALIARILSGGEKITFTKVCSSDRVYELEELGSLEELENIRQTGSVSKVSRTNDITVKVETVFTNTELTEGYYMRTVALYAQGETGGEILYAAAIETSGNCFIPAFEGITVSGAYIQLVTTVSNTENVTLEVDDSVFATIGDIKDLQEQIDSVSELVNAMSGAIGTNAAKLELADKIGYLIYKYEITKVLQCTALGGGTIELEKEKFSKLNNKTYYMYVLSGNFKITGLGASTEIFEGVIYVALNIDPVDSSGQWLPISRGQKGTYYTAPVFMMAATGPPSGPVRVTAQPFIYKRGANNEAIDVNENFTLIATEMNLFVYKLGGLFSTVPGSNFTPGSGLGGSNDYNLLLNKPSINHVILQGDLTPEELGLSGGSEITNAMTYEEALAILNAEESEEETGA